MSFVKLKTHFYGAGGWKCIHKTAWTAGKSRQSSTKEQPAKRAALKNDFVRETYSCRYISEEHYTMIFFRIM